MHLRSFFILVSFALAPPTVTSLGVRAGAQQGMSVAAGVGPCKTCVYVIERIKQGYQYLLPSICMELFKGGLANGAASDTQDYASCHEVVASLSTWGSHIKQWIHHGCYKVEMYGAMELIKPCPSHVMCSQMTTLKQEAFCDAPKPDNLYDFGKAP